MDRPGSVEHVSTAAAGPDIGHALSMQVPQQPGPPIVQSSPSEPLLLAKSAGSRLQQFSNKFKLRRNKPGVGDSASPPPSLPKPAFGRKTADEGSVRSASGPIPETPTSLPAEVGRGFSINKGAAGIEEFNPKASHPSNPLAPIAPLLTKMMKPLTVPSKALMARTFKGRYLVPTPASPLPPSKFDGTPPMGYLWLWMGGFMRWRRRFLVASEAPGVVLIYKRMNMKGKVWSISLRNAQIHPDDGDSRQLKIVTPSGLIFLRAFDNVERDKWVHCLSQSISTYNEKQRLVEGLQQQGLLPPLGLPGVHRSTPRSGRLATMPEGPGGGVMAGGMAGVPAAAAVLDAAGLQLLPNGEVADMDVEQRRRIRMRVGEKLSEIAPYQCEVEAHMNQLSSQLLGVVSALNIRVGNLTPATSNVRLAHFLASSQAASAPPAQQPQPFFVRPPHAPASSGSPSNRASSEGRDPHTVKGEQAGAADGAAGHESGAGGSVAVGAASTSAAAHHSGSGSGLEPGAGNGNGLSGEGGAAAGSGPAVTWAAGLAPGVVAPSSARPSSSEVLEDGTPHATESAPLLGSGASHPLRTMAPTGLRASSRFPVTRPSNLQQAYANLLEAFRCILHGEAVRIAQLEAENQALHRTLQVMKATEVRRLKATRSNAGAAAAAAASAARMSPVARATRGTGGAPAAPGATDPTSSSGPASMARRSPSMSAVHLVRGGSDASSVMTADEDAFDVLEPFDDSVDYGILDDPGYGSLQEGSLEMMSMEAAGKAPDRRRGTQALTDEVAGGTTTELDEGEDDEDGALGGAAGEEEEEEDGEEELLDVDDDEEEEVRKEAEVLQALEVVRQVHYVEQAHSASGLAALLATEAPPPPLASPPEAPGTITGDDEEESDEEEEVEEAGAEVEGAAGNGSGAGADLPISRVSVPVHMRHRSRLPAAKPLGRGFSVWSVLKDMIGKDLTRITMPATINEPLTFLQRLAESFEYYRLLDQVNAIEDSTTRMMMVAVWQLSCYNSQPLREGKPFNPLLGETYEWQSHDGSVKYLCEQVSHHPPVSAFLTRGGLPPHGSSCSKPTWEVQGEYEVKTKFWGKSIELIMSGCEALRLPAHGNEEYRWNKATICVNDLIFGNYYADIYGKVKIVNRTTGDTAVLNLKPCKGRKERRGEFEGSVFDSKGREVYKLFGSTLDKVCAALTPSAAAARGGNSEPVVMWRKDPYPEDFEVQYNFTRFAIELNDPSDPIVPQLPPTDARFRPDQRALEVGEFGRATTEKLRLEEKQRQARRALAEAGHQYRPMWFVQQGGSHPAHATGRKASGVVLTKTVDEDGFVWGFTDQYWKKREAKEWSGCPDLYS